MQIETGIPKEKGVYVCYIDLPFKSKFMEKKLLFWYDEWMHLGSDQKFRDEVHCWIGPLPAPTKDDLKEDKDVAYAIASINQAKNGTFTGGPFKKLSDATKVIGYKGEFIFKLRINQKMEQIRKWSIQRHGWVSKKKK